VFVKLLLFEYPTCASVCCCGQCSTCAVCVHQFLSGGAKVIIIRIGFGHGRCLQSEEKKIKHSGSTGHGK
jgi:hypothetical protein